MKQTKVLLFYKFADIKDTQEFRDKTLSFCINLELKGRIIIAKEGINGSVSGNTEKVNSFKKYLTSFKEFEDISFKEEDCLIHPFKKMVVKIKKEIISFGEDVDMNKKGIYLSPKEFLEMYNDKEAIFLDARNNYESKAGKFKDSITPNISSFKQFKEIIPEIEDYKDKKIVMYCTGGIRCEKASSFLKQKGFERVYQLKDGILNFIKEFPDKAWEGKCFVFDKRLLSSGSDLFPCMVCGEKTDFHDICTNKTCTNLISLCPSCYYSRREFCSSSCEKQHQNNILKNGMKNTSSYQWKDKIVN